MRPGHLNVWIISDKVLKTLSYIILITDGSTLRGIQNIIFLQFMVKNITLYAIFVWSAFLFFPLTTSTSLTWETETVPTMWGCLSPSSGQGCPTCPPADTHQNTTPLYGYVTFISAQFMRPLLCRKQPQKHHSSGKIPQWESIVVVVSNLRKKEGPGVFCLLLYRKLN